MLPLSCPVKLTVTTLVVPRVLLPAVLRSTIGCPGLCDRELSGILRFSHICRERESERERESGLFRQSDRWSSSLQVISLNVPSFVFCLVQMVRASSSVLLALQVLPPLRLQITSGVIA